MAKSPRCEIVSTDRAAELMLRYLGQGPNLTRVDTELLLIALYEESCRNGGIGYAALKIMNDRLKAQSERLNSTAPFNLSDAEMGKEWGRSE